MKDEIKVTFRIDGDVDLMLRRAAKQERRSINAMANILLAEAAANLLRDSLAAGEKQATGKVPAHCRHEAA